MGFRAGETAALREVYRRYAPGVMALLRHGFFFDAGGTSRRFVGFRGPSELHDALHETFRRAFEPRAREAFDGIRPYGPYVRTIARNVVLAEFRAHARRFVPLDVLSAGTEEGEVPASGAQGRDARSHDAGSSAETDPEYAAHLRSLRRLLDAFLDTLDDSDRRLVSLRFEQGLSQREAADELGVGRQVLRRRERDVRAALLEHLRKTREGELASVSALISLASVLLERLLEAPC